MVAHTCNPSTLGGGDRRSRFTASLSSLSLSLSLLSEALRNFVRPGFKIKYKNIGPGVVAHACNPSTWEAETGGSGFAASLSYLVRSSST